MTPETKCIQTIFVVIAAIIIVVINKEMFLETQHEWVIYLKRKL